MMPYLAQAQSQRYDQQQQQQQLQALQSSLQGLPNQTGNPYGPIIQQLSQTPYGAEEALKLIGPMAAYQPPEEKPPETQGPVYWDKGQKKWVRNEAYIQAQEELANANRPPRSPTELETLQSWLKGSDPMLRQMAMQKLGGNVTLKEVVDPNNPTRTILVPESQAAGMAGPTTATQMNQNTEKMADDFRGEQPVKDYRTMMPIYSSMVDAAKKTGPNSRAADINIVYGMAKIMDPGSVVREGEQVIVRDANNLTGDIMSYINKVNAGQSLDQGARDSLVAEARSRLAATKDQYDQLVGGYTDRAKKQGIDVGNVVMDLKPPKNIADDPMFGGAPAGNSIDAILAKPPAQWTEADRKAVEEYLKQ
jgi:hypothetical protein